MRLSILAILRKHCGSDIKPLCFSALISCDNNNKQAELTIDKTYLVSLAQKLASGRTILALGGAGAE